LLTILRNCRSKQFKQPRLTETVCLDELAGDKAEVALEELDKERLLAVIDELPDQYREPLLLFYMNELRYREIAEIVDCPIGTVMSRLARAKAYLRARLAPEIVGADQKVSGQGGTHG
jgi:RNA polymerase sigma-70 factor (ECF subfamily)